MIPLVFSSSHFVEVKTTFHVVYHHHPFFLKTIDNGKV